VTFIQELKALIATFLKESEATCGPKYAAFKDVVVWDEATTERKGYGPNVALVFDGSGYDELSACGEFAMIGYEPYREKVFALAERHGMHAEDCSNCMMTFHQE